MLALGWLGVSVLLSLPWVRELAAVITMVPAILVVSHVARLLDAPPDVQAVAGSVLVRNSRDNLWTRMQEWGYFLGIASVKRMQGLYQGTLVAQGAFGLYRTGASQGGRLARRDR